MWKEFSVVNSLLSAEQGNSMFRMIFTRANCIHAHVFDIDLTYVICHKNVSIFLQKSRWVCIVRSKFNELIQKERNNKIHCTLSVFSTDLWYRRQATIFKLFTSDVSTLYIWEIPIILFHLTNTEI